THTVRLYHGATLVDTQTFTGSQTPLTFTGVNAINYAVTSGDTFRVTLQTDVAPGFEPNRSDVTSATMTVTKTGANATAEWGSITGNLPDQTDLQNALDTKLEAGDFTNTLAQIDDAVDDVQAAKAASFTDTTPVDRLLKLGDFGVGEIGTATSVGSDFNTFLPTGFYRGGSSGSSNYPGATAFGTILSVNRFNTVSTRLSMFHSSSNQELWLTGHDDTGAQLGPPVQFYHTGNSPWVDDGTYLSTRSSHKLKIGNSAGVGVLSIRGGDANGDLLIDPSGGQDFVGFHTSIAGNNLTKLHIGRKFTGDTNFVNWVTVQGADGKVGIGTTEPASNLHIQANGSPTIRIQDEIGSGSYAVFQTAGS
ncbi:MAG TPA: hypothetical protein VKP88_08375, partial [Candidatus Paceibacterota bacterium]|nr:hypothetical protein [Candidatus Paceibacterota bacterium]